MLNLEIQHAYAKLASYLELDTGHYSLNVFFFQRRPKFVSAKLQITFTEWDSSYLIPHSVNVMLCLLQTEQKIPSKQVLR